MKWNDARCTLRLLGINQRAYPRITVIDSGTNLIAAGDEMTNIQQFNFVGGLNGVAEAPFDSGLHGTAVASVVACNTNNSNFISGAASHNLPVRVTTCRVSNDGASIDTLDVLRAMVWCVDHQNERGGPGAINLSINTTQLPTFNGSSVIQEIAKAARKQGDLIVNGSGNSGLVDPSRERYLRRVMAYDENNDVASFSNTGPFKAGAPGVNIAVVTGSPAGILFASGTSLSGPHWASGIAFLQSFSTSSNAVKMDKILYKTADTTAQGNKIPNFNNAVIKAAVWNW
jgi:subtilisin family serine protease